MELADVLDIDPRTLPSLDIDELNWLPISPGIYFMWCGKELFYIGQSRKQGIRDRCKTHRLLPFLREMKNPKITYLELLGESDRGLSGFESALIEKYKPPANRKYQRSSAKRELNDMIRTRKDLKKLNLLPPVLEKSSRDRIYQLEAEYFADGDADTLAQILSDLEQEIGDDNFVDHRVARAIKTSHLYQFCQDVKLIRIPDDDGELYPKDIWAKLKRWYLGQGFLFEERDSKGKPRNRWDEKGRGDRERRRDPLAKGENRVYAGLLRVFPDLKKLKEGSRTLIQGLIFEEVNPTADDKSKEW